MFYVKLLGAGTPFWKDAGDGLVSLFSREIPMTSQRPHTP